MDKFVVTPFLDLNTEDGDLPIREEDLSRLTNAELRQLRISRTELRRCFAKGIKLMHHRDWARERPIAQESLDGEWFVLICGYNQFTHPLMGDNDASNSKKN